jgi:hypothetical protein
VQIRTCGGVYRPEQTGCPAQPMAGARLTFHLINTSDVSRVTTDSSGGYRIDLKPGSYTVQVMDNGAEKRGFAGFAGPQTVIVVAGKTVTADFAYTIQLL